MKFRFSIYLGEGGAPMKVEGTEAFEQGIQWTVNSRSQVGQANEKVADLERI